MRPDKTLVDNQEALHIQLFKLPSHNPQNLSCLRHLGPLLFLLFVNDIPDWIITNIRMFADDTKIWTHLSCPEDVVNLQQDLDVLSFWSAKWLLKFKPLKCKLYAPPAQHGHEILHYSGQPEVKYSVSTTGKRLGSFDIFGHLLGLRLVRVSSRVRVRISVMVTVRIRTSWVVNFTYLAVTGQ